MSSIKNHPILPIPEEDKVAFLFEGKTIYGQRGFTIAAALHQAGLLALNIVTEVCPAALANAGPAKCW